MKGLTIAGMISAATLAVLCFCEGRWITGALWTAVAVLDGVALALGDDA